MSRRGKSTTKGTTRKGESTKLKEELHLHDFRFLLWWGLPRHAARKRLGFNVETAARIEFIMDSDPSLAPSRWATDMIRADDYEYDADLTQVG